MEMKILNNINSLEDFKQLRLEQLPLLAQEIREYIIDIVSVNGGHLASNLGVVELTLALHYVYNSPTDKIIFDVGHQSYIHKLLTGRREELKTLRLEGGLSGFPKTTESQHDVFNTGHSSTSISAALGMARARDLDNDNYNVVCVIGDGALGGGMAFEALNDVGFEKHKMLIIINDNTMSISKNVGGMSRHLSRLRVSKRYVSFKHKLKTTLERMPLGKPLMSGLQKSRDLFRFMVIKNKMFDQLGLKYIGPIDGHNTNTLVSYFESIKNIDVPVVLHIITSKGKGDVEAESNPIAFHGLSSKAEFAACFSTAAGEELCNQARTNKNIAVFSAAMPIGTGMDTFQNEFPERFFDVGIAEEHAVTCAAGLAMAGKKPYVAVYSTFLQRAFDQILHDVCLQNLPVTFLVDRAGIVGEDGETHQGIYDLSYLGLMPNMTIIAPKDVYELKKAIEFSTTFNAPLAIRYPKCSQVEFETGEVEFAKWQVLNEGNNNVAILAVGNRMQALAHGFSNCRIINPLFIKPLDTEMLDWLCWKEYRLIVLEENSYGGLYSQIVNYYAKNNDKMTVLTLPVPEIVAHGTIDSCLSSLGFTSENISNLIKKAIE